ncbi:vitrin isoform 2-T2 [Leptodactylus fuscus]|uniref:vitrin isoform X2 n=1 Tax=Leptodactylus fuscus TaxID=238119 RepID=UPI003F4F1C73
MMKEKFTAVLLVLILTCTCVSSKKNRKNKQHAPHIDCDIKAGKIVNPEFLAKCPAGCQNGKHRVYGTDIYASFSSICTAAIHSGVIDNSGGKILVRKVAGQSGYKGSFSNGIRSLSLPRWKESFVVAEGKGKKGVTYPTVLEFVEVPVPVEPAQREAPAPTVARTTALTTIPTTTPTTPEPTTPQPTTPKPTTTTPATTTTTTTTPTTTTTARTRPPILRARDTAASNIHPAYSSVAAASSRQAVPAVPGRAPNQAVRSPTTYSSSRQILRSNPGAGRIQQILAEKASQANSGTQRRDWQSPSRVNVPVVQRRPAVPERSNVAPNTRQSWSSDTRDPQGAPRRDWQTPSRVNVPVVQRRPPAPESSNSAPPSSPNWFSETYDTEGTQRREWGSQNQRLNVPPVRRPAAPESSNVAPPAAPYWPVETRDTQVSNPRSSVSEYDRWVSGFSQSNSRSSESDTTWKVVEEVPETKVQAKPDAAPDPWRGFSDPVQHKPEVKVDASQDPWRGFSDPVQRKPEVKVDASSDPWRGFSDPVQRKPEVKLDAAPDPWRGFSESGRPVKEEINVRQPAETVALGGANCKIDLVFLIDGSWSIGKRRFRLQKLFLNQMAEALDVGLSGPLMGIVQYGDDPYTEFSLRSYFNSKDLKNAIDKIPQKGGHSNVGKALSYINKNYFSDASGNRGGAPNVAVVLVDGWPTDKVEEASRLARESGINIFFVTIEGADDNERSNVVEPNFVDKAVCRTNGHFSVNIPSWFGLPKIVNPLVKRMCDIDKLVCSKTCLNAADIGFVIDGSSSVGTGNFRTVLQFIANITSEFEISDTDTRIGAVQYTYEQRLEFGFDKYSTKQDVVNAIMRIGYWSGGTSTGAAITYASDQLFSKSKPNKRKIMIVITDGRSYDDVRAPAAAAHRSGVIAYAVGVAWAAQDELESIATDPDKDHSFFVDEFDSLYKFVGKIIQNICTEYNSQPRN